MTIILINQINFNFHKFDERGSSHVHAVSCVDQINWFINYLILNFLTLNP